MELRQLRYFVKVVEFGSMGRAATELGVVTSALSQQISRLEGELSTRLLQRSSTGVRPTDAGVAFWRQAQLVLRHADEAARAAQQARLSGHVSVGLAPSTAAVLGLPLMQAMRARYPDVRLHLVENLSGHLTQMLNARQLDLAVLFQSEAARRWSVMPLLDEALFVIGSATLPGLPTGDAVRLDALGELPLILPSGPHGLRALLNQSFQRAGLPGSAAARLLQAGLRLVPLADDQARRPNLLVSLSDDELSPAALATRVVMTDVARTLVREGRWVGARLHEN
ncbi:MAG: hypothetical protein RL260_2346 [Pseudomonadota bacterium]